MKRIITSTLLAVTFLFTATLSKAQTAMNFSKADCNGTMHDCFADLDAGKAVILHFFMPAPCSSCPPPAQKIQMMANNILATHPGLITAYAFPYNNTTSCSNSQSWVNNNGLSLYSPMDSGATLVANYGGFGMPTIVLLGGTDHRVMFSTLSFATNDTTTMRDSILAMLAPAAINDLPNNISALDIYPNPANEQLTLKIEAKEAMPIYAEMLDMMGHRVALLANEKSIKTTFTKSFNTSSLSNGFYILKIKVGESVINRKVNVTH